MRRILVYPILLLLFCASFHGCGKNNTAYYVTIAGEWSVTFTSPEMSTGSFDGAIEFIQNNTALAGTLTFSPEEGIDSSGSISGSIIKGNVSLSYESTDSFTLIMGGRAKEESISGTFTLIYPSGISSGPTYTGTYVAEKQASS